MGPGTMLRLMPRMLRFMRPMRKWNTITIAQFVERFKNPRGCAKPSRRCGFPRCRRSRSS